MSAQRVSLTEATLTLKEVNDAIFDRRKYYNEQEHQIAALVEMGNNTIFNLNAECERLTEARDIVRAELVSARRDLDNVRFEVVILQLNIATV